MAQKVVILLLVTIVSLAGATWSAQTDASSDVTNPVPLQDLDGTAPIIVWNRAITVLRASFEGVPPAERARQAIARIEALPTRSGYELSTIEASSKEVKGIIVKAQTEVLFALLPGDVDANSGQTLEAAAQAAADRLKSVLDERAGQMKWANLTRSLGYSALATLLYLLLIWAVFRFRRIVAAKIEGRIDQLHHVLTIAGINLVPIFGFIGRIAIKLALAAIFFTTTYLWLTYCFSQFFFTQPWAEQLGEYLVGFLTSIALAILGAVPGVLTVCVVFWLTRIVTSGISRFFEGVQKGSISVGWLQPDSARASRRIIIAMIWLFSLTVAYPYIPGSGSEAFKGVSVFTGLMLSLGATGFINHVMSGLVIAYSGSMRVGDFVSVNDTVGVVEELGTISAKIATPKKEYVTIPNGVVVSGHVVNYSRMAGKDGAVISTTVTIGYDTPWRQVHALLVQAANKTPGIRKLPPAYVLQKALLDFYVEYELRAHIDRPEQRLGVLSALHAGIQDAFNEAGVQIMSPNFVAQPEKAVLVAKSQWYAAPAVQDKDQ